MPWYILVVVLVLGGCMNPHTDYITKEEFEAYRLKDTEILLKMAEIIAAEIEVARDHDERLTKLEGNGGINARTY